MNRIIRNSAECFQCGDKIESTHVHDFKFCSCGNIAVDGGKEYLKRCGDIGHKNSKDTSMTEIVLSATILSGISGAGKSTWVKDECDKDCIVVSADNFFMVNGEYKFDVSKLSQAHESCLRDFIERCRGGSIMKANGEETPALVVDNTNTTVEEIAPYYSVARAYGYEVELVTLLVDPALAARNVHGVPFRALDAMHQRLVGRKLPPFWNIKQSMYQWEADRYSHWVEVSRVSRVK